MDLAPDALSDPKLFVRFWSRVEFGPSCWVWTGSLTWGYGHIGIRGRSYRPHRIAYQSFIGPIPKGLVLDHLCRNRGCVNPAHLEPVTAKENTLRGISFSAINAVKTHCTHGHEFTEKNTYRRRKGRECKACRAYRAFCAYHLALNASLDQENR